MDRSSAGISGQYTIPGNGNNQPKEHAASSRRGRYRHAPVRQWCHPPRTAPGRNELYYSSAACSFQHLQRRSVNRTSDFNNLIKQKIMDSLVNRSNRIGHRYDGKYHGQYASSIKKYTSAAKRPLNRTEQSQLICFLQNFTATPGWNWRSLTTTFHSFTSAGVFTPHNPMDERVKRTQAALLSTLLDAIRFKCNQKPQAMNIDPRGVVNLLWAMAKLVNGQKWAPGLKEAVAALLPHVNPQKDRCAPQHIANLVWAMAKLVDNGLEQIVGLKEAVTSLLPHLNTQKNQFIPQHIANLLWAMAKLVDNGQERTPGFNEAVVALLPRVKAHKDRFNAQASANLLWAMAKLVDNGQQWTPGLKEAVTALLPRVNAQKASFKPQEVSNLLWAMAKLVDNGQKLTAELKAAVAALLPYVNAHKANFQPQEITNLLWVIAKLSDNNQERTTELNEAVAALLPHVNAQQANFQPQEIANLLWAVAKLGELVELNVVTSTFESLVYRISENPQFSQQAILMSLWGVMVCCARLSLASNSNKNNCL
ncbi:DUF1601 domain-containing protein [Thalassotalea sp. G20_0]|uniref:DUF1601 domain-containing protein n=1 Tax=Thalassotalea sp. G20_0 TaxID=2821093 RepID=UPI001ADB098C|nr:DUF1601 domain-containing protein [Thalassotalea sp. G20_0]MBO9495651.1 DUF1601 domain-containing protein [Thalassotalea sp. G20_0]